MPSWQTYILNPMIRFNIKRKLGRARTAASVRSAFGSTLPAPKGVTYSADNIGGVAGEWVQASTSASPAGTMLYLHGGGYIACSPRTHRAITASYAKHGLKLFVPDYRLAPENPFPAAVEDALAVYKGLLAAGVSPLSLTLSGDSAGGGLALALLLAAKAAGLPLPASCIVFSPWTDLAATGQSLKSNLKRDVMLNGNHIAEGAAQYLQGAESNNPLASPLYGDLTSLPPLLIMASDSEVLRDDATRLAARATASGVQVQLEIWPGMPHAWPLFYAFLPEARTALTKGADFAKARFAVA